MNNSISLVNSITNEQKCFIKARKDEFEHYESGVKKNIDDFETFASMFFCKKYNKKDGAVKIRDFLQSMYPLAVIKFIPYCCDCEYETKNCRCDEYDSFEDLVKENEILTKLCLFDQNGKPYKHFLGMPSKIQPDVSSLSQNNAKKKTLKKIACHRWAMCQAIIRCWLKNEYFKHFFEEVQGENNIILCLDPEECQIALGNVKDATKKRKLDEEIAKARKRAKKEKEKLLELLKKQKSQ